MIEAVKPPVVFENPVLIRRDQNMVLTCSFQTMLLRFAKMAYQYGTMTTLLTPGGVFHSISLSRSPWLYRLWTSEVTETRPSPTLISSGYTRHDMSVN